MAERIPKNRENSPTGGTGGISVLPVILYAAVEGLALIILKTLELRGIAPGLQTGLMYGAIVLNTVTALAFLIIFRKKGTSEAATAASESCRMPFEAPAPLLFHALALLFTLAADTVLVLLDRWYLLGVLLFCAVQTFYALMLWGRIRTVIIRLGCFLLTVVLLLIFRMAEPLTIASAYSITQLVINTATAWGRVFGKNRTSDGETFRSVLAMKLLTALGLSLFFLCDVCVGLYNLSYGIRELLLFHRVSGFLMWVFYLPSQVLLVLSFGIRTKFGRIGEIRGNI